MPETSQQAFVLRIVLKDTIRVSEALSENQIIIGWAEAKGLLDSALLWEQFREIIRLAYHPTEETLRKAGAAAGHMWRFIREMNVGDLVVVPCRPEFFVAEISGPATYDPTKIADDTAYRRNVKWLNDKKPIRRDRAKSALVSRMKMQGTCAYASDLLDDIKECLLHASKNQAPTFHSDLQMRLVRETLEELRTGRLDDFRFERLIETVLLSLGAEKCRIVPRNKDKGADLIATFRVAGAFQQTVAVQAKHWKPEPPVNRGVVEQLIRGIEAEMANLGMVITSGSIADDAYQAAQQYFDDKGVRIEFLDGEDFAKLIVEYGIHTS